MYTKLTNYNVVNCESAVINTNSKTYSHKCVRHLEKWKEWKIKRFIVNWAQWLVHKLYATQSILYTQIECINTFKRYRLLEVMDVTFLLANHYVNEDFFQRNFIRLSGWWNDRPYGVK